MKKIIKLLLVCLVWSLILSGCSKKQKEQCEETVAAFLTGYQSLDTTCGNYLSGNSTDSNIKFEGFQVVLAESLQFDIESVEIDKEYNTVIVQISNVDFGSVFESMINDEKSESKESIVPELKQRLQAENAPRKEFEVPIKLTKDNKIEMTSELSNALLGGYPKYIYELTEGGLK